MARGGCTRVRTQLILESQVVKSAIVILLNICWQNLTRHRMSNRIKGDGRGGERCCCKRVITHRPTDRGTGHNEGNACTLQQPFCGVTSEKETGLFGEFIGIFWYAICEVFLESKLSLSQAKLDKLRIQTVFIN